MPIADRVLQISVPSRGCSGLDERAEVVQHSELLWHCCRSRNASTRVSLGPTPRYWHMDPRRRMRRYNKNTLTG